ncbi:fibroblast growth factor receptor 2 [Folsomia candida]|uniref:fibroblast growth factor receptor 2 n=1 Tax=Folsomia candida TaxID=158441 RepID=UPI00160543AD|nr:fibroblast growth factor receptor 2 [Folsomia candida]
MDFWRIILTFKLLLVLTSCLPLPPSEENCIRSVGQINCVIPEGLIWSCVKPNLILVKGSTTNLEDDRSSALSSHGSQQLLVNCTAPFPIDVRVSGFQVHDLTRALFVRNAENVFNEATFVYSVGLRYDRQPFSRVRTISVVKLRDATVTFSVFHLGMNESSESTRREYRLEQSPKTTIIPCISPDPTNPPKLVHVTGNESQTVNGTEYDDTQGFLVKNENGLTQTFTEEIYDCYLNGRNDKMTSINTTDNINANLRFKLFPRKELQVYPEFQRVILFQKDELSLICRSNKKVQLVGVFRGESVKAKTTIEFDEFTSTLNQKFVQVGDKGNVSCVDEETKTVLFSWTIQILDIEDNNELMLKKISEDLVSCVSSPENQPAKLRTVFCQGETNCEASKWCLEPGMTCPGMVGTPCEDGSCLQMNTSNPILSQGMIHCQSGNYTYTTNFFRGFDGILYLDWKTAPLNALVEVFVPPKNITMYPHNSYPFGCRAAPFISDGLIQWVIRGKDGSEILLHKKRVQNIGPTYSLDANLYTVRESNIRLIYPNDYDVLCMVPLWNATGSLRYHKRINVAAHVAPVKEILIASACIIILLIIPLVIVILRLRKARAAIRNLTEQEVEQFLKGDPSTLNSKDKDAHEKITATPYNQDFEIPRHKLLIDNENKLGEGAFGLVLKGKVEGMSDVVAVKTMKPRCEVDQFKGFMSELKIMMYIGRHPNVVALVGAHTDKIKEKIMHIVVEYCANGSLDKLLLANKNRFINQVEDGNRININITPTSGTALYNNVAQCNDSGEKLENNQNYSTDPLRTVDLFRWAYQIASGMNFLATKKVVHADLAARNVLIHDNGTAKITDFGLSRQLMNYTQYVKKHQEPLPWGWMAEESLRYLSFSTQSDIWAFGVTLWEMFSLGDIPYPGLTWTIAFVDDLSTGLRMTKPNYAPTFTYDMMLNCWHHKPESRPSFEQLATQFKGILEALDIHVEEVISSSPPVQQQDNNARVITNSISTNKRSTVGNLYANQN